MHSPNTADTKGNSKSSSSQLRSHGRGHNDDHNDRADGHHEHFHALKQLFRSKSSPHSTTEPSRRREQHGSHRGRRDHQSSGSSQSSRRRHKAAPRSKSLDPPVPRPIPGTRGHFTPAYGQPRPFAQGRRQRNPIAPLPVNGKRSPKSNSQVIVQFYNCENLYIGRSFLTSPDLKRLESAAVAFLGECQLHDMPETSIPRRPNPAYRGLSLQGSHGYHLHFPDCAGMKPFHSILADDWAAVMRRHRRSSPDGILLVGVGIGEPGSHCL